jgi:hypothetical protein
MQYSQDIYKRILFIYTIFSLLLSLSQKKIFCKETNNEHNHTCELCLILYNTAKFIETSFLIFSCLLGSVNQIPKVGLTFVCVGRRHIRQYYTLFYHNFAYKQN